MQLRGGRDNRNSVYDPLTKSFIDDEVFVTDFSHKIHFKIIYNFKY